MKILHIIPTLGIGGAEKLLVDLLHNSQHENAKSDVAVLSNYDNVYEDDIKDNCNAYFTSNSPSVYHMKNILFIKRLLKAGTYDLVHCHLYAAQLFTPIAKIIGNSKIPLVTTEHSTNNRRRNIKFFKPIDTMMYRHYEKIICISQGTKDEMDSYLPNLAKKSYIIQNGINLNKFKDAEPVNWYQELTSYNGEKIILMVASFRHQKDPYTLIRAAKLLDTSYKVVFVGEGELLGDAITFAKYEKVSNVEFLGKRKDIPELMKAAHLFVLSSKWEGFGLVVVEAVASGLDVIGSDVSGLRDVVQDLCGQVFAPGDERELAQKINNVDFMKKLIPQELEKYDIANTVVSYIQLYKDILEKKKD
ncbi:glycosyltransferase [Solibacillus sp. FSL K6-1523]|uniref:glycosyltransferase n=1 Tax=Solibacillus sp. FSL K6-1523 TaxID=2921471 RepID=UPI0030F601B8